MTGAAWSRDDQRGGIRFVGSRGKALNGPERQSGFPGGYFIHQALPAFAGGNGVPAEIHRGEFGQGASGHAADQSNPVAVIGEVRPAFTTALCTQVPVAKSG